MTHGRALEASSPNHTRILKCQRGIRSSLRADEENIQMVMSIVGRRQLKPSPEVNKGHIMNVRFDESKELTQGLRRCLLR
jgi:hypothetical protein